MLLKVLDGRGVDELRERETLIEGVPLQTIDGRRDEVDGLANLDRSCALTLHEGCGRNGTTSRCHPPRIPKNHPATEK
jgi:hypothetical protein